CGFGNTQPCSSGYGGYSNTYQSTSSRRSKLFLSTSREDIPMKKIVCLGDPFTSPVTKGTGSYKIGICLGEAPSANVVVSLASSLGRFTVTSTLTFTTSNWFTFQEATI